MNQKDIFKLINECFYDSKPIVPSSKRSLKMIGLIEECFRKSNQKQPDSLKTLDMTLDEIDSCIDCVSDILCNEGFESNSEPNPYGLELEDAISFLLHFRYALVDNHDELRRLTKK